MNVVLEKKKKKNTWLPTKHQVRDALQGQPALKASCDRHVLVASCGGSMGLAMGKHGGQALPGAHLQKQHSPSHTVEHAPKAMEEGNWRDAGDRSPARGLPDVTDTCHPSASSLFQAPCGLPGPSQGGLCLGFSQPLRAPGWVPTSGAPCMPYI